MSDEQKKDVPLQPTAGDSDLKEPQAPKSGEGDSTAAAEANGAEPGETKPTQAKQPEEQASPEAQAHKVEKAPLSADRETEGASAPKAANTETKESQSQESSSAASADEEKEAKAKAAAEARAARASARAKKPEAEEDAGPKEPSPNQPRLDRAVQILKTELGEDSVEEAFINERDAHLPYLVVKNDKWLEAAQLLRDHEELKLNYLRNVSGIDQETHMEVAYHLLSLDSKHEYCVKVKTPRDTSSIPSVTFIWPTANWNEREIYDLLGIDFPGHPDMRRIMMSDDWVGHPLRKDYEPLDPEV
ncbi:NADH-quinone oxidoreductase subunit C [Paenibacillus rigui]|uniref:NADH-quinone oxidoreductase subunit C n=1 Tax=Paenibacillus rigui TaxID=554312 RepID=A0A229UT11_9BACL|nr:NADH-quinone oxidoreductase subunit C [Paenibacillus rigui]OXM86401.1 NADH-quinone oxidoreductase subunit C [Paenibacillus rigui]